MMLAVIIKHYDIVPQMSHLACCLHCPHSADCLSLVTSVLVLCKYLIHFEHGVCEVLGTPLPPQQQQQ